MAIKRTNGRHNGPTIDLTKGTVPVIIVASLLVFIAVAGYQIGRVVNSVQTESVLTDQRFDGIERELAKIRAILENNDAIKPTDFKSWCLVTESQNKGWKCGDIDRLGIK